MSGFFDYVPHLREVFEGADLDGMSFDRFAAIATGQLDRRRMALSRDEMPLEERLTRLIERAFGWAKSEYRIAQIRDPDVRKVRPKICLLIDLGCCAAADKLRQAFIAPDDLVRLPLAGCDRKTCGCDYATLGKRELGRLEAAGLLSGYGDLQRQLALRDFLSSS